MKNEALEELKKNREVFSGKEYLDEDCQQVKEDALNLVDSFIEKAEESGIGESSVIRFLGAICAIVNRRYPWMAEIEKNDNAEEFQENMTLDEMKVATKSSFDSLRKQISRVLLYGDVFTLFVLRESNKRRAECLIQKMQETEIKFKDSDSGKEEAKARLPKAAQAAQEDPFLPEYGITKGEIVKLEELMGRFPEFDEVMERNK